MEETKTAEEWKFENLRIIDQEGRTICKFPSYDIKENQVKRNVRARLMAKAPTILAELTQQQSANAELKKQNEELVEIAKAFLILSKESTGVTGWHNNRDIAYWDEFDLVKMAEKALNTPPKN